MRREEGQSKEEWPFQADQYFYLGDKRMVRKKVIIPSKRTVLSNNAPETPMAPSPEEFGQKAKAKKLIKMYEDTKSLRRNWDTTWAEIADYVVPSKDQIFTDKFHKTKGDEKNDHLYDGSPEHFNELLASALHSMLTNPAGQWFSLTTNKEEVDNDPEVKKYLQLLVRNIHDFLNNSNFQTEIHEFYIDLGSFGTGAILVVEDTEDIFRFLSIPIFELHVLENSKGIIDTVFREDTISVRKAFERFGEDAFGEFAEELKKDFNKPVRTVHIIMPRTDIEFGKLNKRNKKFASIHVWIDRDIILKESGFDENPYIISRWIKSSGETYGRSPAMKSLPDIRMLNSMMQTTIRSAQKTVDPPLMIPDDGIMGRVNTIPGGLNSYRSGTEDRIFPLLTGGDIGIGLEMLRDVRDRIKQAFFIDQLQLKEGPQMTATEVNQRVEEQLRLLGPILGRQHFELLKPLIARLISIMGRKKVLPENPPPILAVKDGQLNVFFSSQIAKAQRVADATNVQRFIESSAVAIQIQPNAADIINSEEIIKLNARLFGVDQRIFREDSEVEEIRQDRNNEEEAMAEEQTNQANAKTAADLTKAQGG